MRSWELFEGVVGADSFGIDRGSNSAIIQPWFGGELGPIVGRSGYDRATIVVKPRSTSSDEFGRGVALIPRWMGLWSRLILAPMARRSGNDRVAIGPRSRRDRVLLSTMICWRRPSDGDRTVQRVPRLAKVRGRSRVVVAVWWRSRDHRVSTPCSPIVKSGRSVTVRWRSTHPGESTRHWDRERSWSSDEALIHSRRWSNASRVSTCHEVRARSHPLTPPIKHMLMMVIKWTQRPSNQRLSIEGRAFDVFCTATSPAS